MFSFTGSKERTVVARRYERWELERQSETAKSYNIRNFSFPLLQWSLLLCENN